MKDKIRRSKKTQKSTPENETNVMHSSARGIKSKANSLKQILINNPWEIIALCETHLKQNEKVNVPGYKWIGLNRKDKDGGGIAFLINNNKVKSFFEEPQANDGTLEIMTIRLELKQNKTIMICIYYGEQETKTNKQEAKKEFDYLSQHISKYLQNDNHLLLLGDFNAKIGNDEHGVINGPPHISRNSALLRDVIKDFNLEILNNKLTEGKWTRINSNNINKKSLIDYFICNNKLTKHIAKVIIEEKQDFVLTEKKKADHNTIFLKIAAEPRTSNKKK